MLFCYDRLTNSEKLYNELCIPRLGTVLELEQIKLMYNILSKLQKTNINIVMSNNVHMYDTRSHENIYQLYTRTDLGLRNPYVLASKVFNKVPGHIRGIHNYRMFVKQIKAYLGFK